MATEVSVKIRYEDDHLAIISKPAGVLPHPAVGCSGETLVEDLRRHWPANYAFDHVRYGLVHRLDKETSGLLLVAKSADALERLKAHFAMKQIEKRYLAVVHGLPVERSGVIEAPVGRHATLRHKMSVHPGGKLATTRYTVLAENGTFAALDVRIETGRTHQIRVHLSALGHPIVGDAVYGTGTGRQLLHARYLAFAHPVTGEPVTVEDELPGDISDFLSLQGINAG